MEIMNIISYDTYSVVEVVKAMIPYGKFLGEDCRVRCLLIWGGVQM